MACQYRIQRPGGRGPRNMKSMWPPLAAIFFMPYFYRARGNMAPSRCGSRIPCRRGRRLSGGATYDFVKFSKKLHEVEKILGRRGAHAGGSPLRSANDDGSKEGAPHTHPSQPKIFAIACSFLENFGKIVGWRPLLRGILDPPLLKHYILP